jgi:hypothetical protein
VKTSCFCIGWDLFSDRRFGRELVDFPYLIKLLSGLAKILPSELQRRTGHPAIWEDHLHQHDELCP